LGDRKGVWSVKTFDSKPIGMTVNVNGCHDTNWYVGTKKLVCPERMLGIKIT